MAYKDPEDQKKASAAHYQKHKKQYKSRVAKRNKHQRQTNREFVARVKRMMCCVDCGEQDPIVLEFDHVRGKKKRNLADMANQSYCINTIKEEMRKCDIRCANCHRKKTHTRRKRNK